jgi:hypothetical protein
MPMKDLQDGRRLDLGVIVPLKIETDANGAVTTLFTNAKDQRHNLRRNTIPDVVWSPGLIYYIWKKRYENNGLAGLRESALDPPKKRQV